MEQGETVDMGSVDAARYRDPRPRWPMLGRGKVGVGHYSRKMQKLSREMRQQRGNVDNSRVILENELNNPKSSKRQ